MADSSISNALALLRSRKHPPEGEEDLLLIEEVAEIVAMFEGLVEPGAFGELDQELRAQAAHGSQEARGLLRELVDGWVERASRVAIRSAGARGLPLQPYVFARLQRIPDVLAVAEQIERDGSPDELNRLLAHLASISPGKSKALDRLIDLVGTLPHPAAASTAEGLRRRVHYRRVPRADLTLRIFDRVEDWAFQLEDAFGDITEIPPARAGLFVKMAEDLCNLHSAGDWREAAEGLTAANFHDLAAVFENRARELTSP